jgi:hypothetical protein
MAELHVNPTQAGTNDRIEGILKEGLKRARRGELIGMLALGVRADGEVEIGSCLTPGALKTIAEKLPEVLSYLSKHLDAAKRLAEAPTGKAQ